MWIYAAIQFALVVVFAHIFYSLVRSWSNILNCLKVRFMLVSVQPEINAYMSYILFHAMKRERGGLAGGAGKRRGWGAGEERGCLSEDREGRR